MPRKSAAARSSIIVDVRQERLEPPNNLGKDETRLFRDLVASCDPTHFRRSDAPLLCRYVESVILAEDAARELRESGPVAGGKPSPWLQVQEKAIRAMTALSLRLRLSPQSRLDPKTAAREKSRTGPMPWEDDWKCQS